VYEGSSKENNANRVVFGEAASDILDDLSKEEAAEVLVVDMIKGLLHARHAHRLLHPRQTALHPQREGRALLRGAHEFVPRKDDVIIDGTDGFVISLGEMLYKSYAAVLCERKAGMNIGLVNKPTLNLVDEQVLRKIGTTKFVLVVDSQNENTGIGSKMGTWLSQSCKHSPGAQNR